MTDQERVKAFEEKLQALCKEYGITLHNVVNARKYGDMLQIEPGEKVGIELDPNWQPPAPNEDDPKK